MLTTGIERMGSESHLEEFETRPAEGGAEFQIPTLSGAD